MDREICSDILEPPRSPIPVGAVSVLGVIQAWNGAERESRPGMPSAWRRRLAVLRLAIGRVIRWRPHIPQTFAIGSGPLTKLVSLEHAVRRHLHDGDTLFVGGFGQCIPYAIGHEIVRQGRKDLVLCRSGGGHLLRSSDRRGLRREGHRRLSRQSRNRAGPRFPARGRSRHDRGRGLDQFRHGPAPACGGLGRTVPAGGDHVGRRSAGSGEGQDDRLPL
jgi:hypothetical protein